MTTTRPATAKQLAFIQSLAAARDLGDHAVRLAARIDAGDLDVATASRTIEWLKAIPAVAVPEAPAAPARAAEGFYVRGDEVIKVKWNKARTGTYALRFVVAGGKARFEYAPGVGRSLADEGLRPMTAADAARIGLHHGFCVNCCAELGGATLSANVSAAIGYGETCARNNGWDYPKGAKAQRAYLAAQAPVGTDRFNAEWADMKNAAARREAAQERAAYAAEEGLL